MLIPAEFNTFRRRKMLISVKLLTKYVMRIYALGSVHEKSGVWIKEVPKSKFPAGLGGKEWLSRSKLKQAFLIDSDAELFRSLIQCIRLGSWKVHVRRLNRALRSCNKALGKNTSFQIGDSPSAPFNDLCINFHKCVNLTSILCSQLYGHDWLQTCRYKT